MVKRAGANFTQLIVTQQQAFNFAQQLHRHCKATANRQRTMVSIAQKIFSKKIELAVSKVRLKSNLDDNTIQSEKKSWEKVENGGI